MGEGQFGGDGSVKWIVTTEDPERPFGGPQAPRTDGAIDNAPHGGRFVVRLKVPLAARGSEEAFRISGKLVETADGLVVEFNLPIEPVAKQIHILWGRNNTATS